MRIQFKRKPKHNFPLVVEDMWLAGITCMNDGVDYGENPRTILMPYYDNDGKYVKYKGGDIVPLFSDDTGTAYYKIVDWKLYPGSDPAYFDDKREYTLELHHIDATDPASEPQSAPQASQQEEG